MPVTLGQATPADLLQAQKDGVIIVDIRRPDEWAQTGVIEGAETITAFEANGRLHPEFQQKFMAVVPSPDTPRFPILPVGKPEPQILVWR